MSGMPLRDYRVHRYVNAFCPMCHAEAPDRPLADVRRLSGWLAVRGEHVWLERGCPDHGLVSTLYDESAEILSYLEQWTAPTKVHQPDVPGNFKPVPSAYEDGLPEMQTQHTCILLADITDHCNLRCPTCFSESAPALASVAPLAEVLASVDTRLSRENGRIDVLMLSGGEPTLYPWLAELLDEVTARPVVRAAPLQPHLLTPDGQPTGEAPHVAERTVRLLLVAQRAERVDVAVHAVVAQRHAGHGHAPL